MVEACGGGILATSGVEEDAMRLLGAFYDLSGGKLTEPVPIGGPEMPGQGAAPRADLDPESTECDGRGQVPGRTEIHRAGRRRVRLHDHRRRL